jgi:outer membrane lipoprotein-sorting protein
MFVRRPRLRWAVPAAVGAFILGGVAIGTAAVSADSGLPPKTAEQLLVELQSPQAAALSGTIVTSAELGLPALPAGVASAAGPQSLLTGTNTVRVWLDGDDRSRVAFIADADEYDVIRDGADVWVWASGANTADHFVVHERAPSDPLAAQTSSTDLPSTPQAAAAMALAALDGTTEVTTSGVGRVAGRPVYELILTPTRSETLVARVVIALDAETHVPLRVQVFSTQLSDPAFEVGFTSVDFAKPDADVFSFTPSPGVTVTQHPEAAAGETPGHGPTDSAVTGEPAFVGTGWSRVVVASVPQPPGDGDHEGSPSAGDLAALLESLPVTSGDWGTGRVLSGTLISAIVTDDGRIALGSVTPEALGAALAKQ